MANNTVRIIGGQWRGRKISFPDAPGLRPTPDRVKETLFNWLMYHIHGARCLDAYAGSGALGLEALSRGAQEVVFLEQQMPAIKALRDNIAHLQAATHTQVVPMDTLQWLASPAPNPFDIVFVDPPFQHSLWLPTLELLKTQGWVHADSVVSVEYPAHIDMVPPITGWTFLKQKQMGQVQIALLRPRELNIV